MGEQEEIEAALNTLTIQAPLHSDVDFTFAYFVGTSSGYIHKFTHPVTVLAIADPPQVTATETILVEEDAEPYILSINAVKSDDVDDSEYLSVDITLAMDGFGPIGDITAPLLPEGSGIPDPKSWQVQYHGQR